MHLSQETGIDETLSISLGPDPSVRVRYKPVRVASEVAPGQNGRDQRCTTYSHLTLIKNDNEFPISLQLTDQLPVSDNEKLRITLLDPIKGKDVIVNAENNVEWTVCIPGQKTMEVLFAYQVSR